MMSLLNKYFHESIPDDVQPNVVNYWWNTLVEHYYTNNRRCHSLEDLNERLQHFETAKVLLKNPSAVSLALLFRYYEYDPKLADCSDINIIHFQRFSVETKMNANTTLCEEVISLLKVGATNSTDEHKIEGCFGCEDKHYFLDIDMAILGTGPDDYKKYTKHVRAEYDFLDDQTYKDLRIKVLESFLQIPNIYATQLFREKYETLARKNIQVEITSLKSEETTM